MIERNIEQGGFIDPTANVNNSTIIEFPVFIGKESTVGPNTKIGKYAFVNASSIIYGNVSIGKYCSFGRYVEIGLAQHPTSYLTTHHLAISQAPFPRDIQFASVKKIPWIAHPKTTIGNDVWIGAKACIKSGITIGDGAIIAAGAIVVKDVMPYTIVGGNPAKLIRNRFSEDIINQLMSIKWWDMPLEEIQHLPFDNVDECISLILKIKNKNIDRHKNTI